MKPSIPEQIRRSDLWRAIMFLEGKSTATIESLVFLDLTVEVQGYKRQRAHAKNYHLATQAQRTLAHALRTGKLKRPDRCERCGEIPTFTLHGHHEDYAEMLNVIFLCPRCHVLAHLVKKS